MDNRNALVRISVRLFSLIAITIALTMTTKAQAPSPAPVQTAQAIPAANPADVASMDSIIAALYDVISGPAGNRNWDRFRSLFVAGARLIPTGARPTGEVSARVLSPDDYALRAGALFEKQGF